MRMPKWNVEQGLREWYHVQACMTVSWIDAYAYPAHGIQI